MIDSIREITLILPMIDLQNSASIALHFLPVLIAFHVELTPFLRVLASTLYINSICPPFSIQQSEKYYFLGIVFTIIYVILPTKINLLEISII